MQVRIGAWGKEKKEKCLLGKEKGKSGGRSACLVTFLCLLTKPFLVTGDRRGEAIVMKQLLTTC